MKPLIHTYYTYIYPVLVYSIPYGNAYFVTTLQVLNTYLVKNLSLPVQAGNSLGHSNKNQTSWTLHVVVFLLWSKKEINTEFF